jgi:hypothetical protein
MKFLKTHYARAIKVIPSDTVDIPNPAGLGMTGTADETNTDQLTDTTATFTTNLQGAVVINKTTGSIANVVGFINSIKLALDADIFSSGDEYEIYNSDNNQGCSIYIPAQTPAKLTVKTVGGDVITLTGCGSNTDSIILPLSVVRVMSTETGLANMVALW